MLDGLNLGAGFAERFLFPAPDPSYGPQSYKRHLCWIPWNEVISPQRVKDEKCLDGIPCLWFPAPKAATVILFFHANAEDLGMSFAVLKHMRDQFKVNVLSVEYPGYGLLHHMQTNEDAVYEVALTAFRFLVDEVNVRYSQIILFGRSLGSGPAVYLAAQYPVGGLILVNAISSVKAAVQSVAGRLIAWTWRERFPNHKIIANVSCSTLFIHGECDGLLPPEHSLRLFKRCRARKLLITPPKMEHNSNLFGDASFLAVPAIHFFGFPGYYTSTPPRLPAALFENPERRARLRDQMQQDSTGSQPWLCGCLAKGDPHHLDVTFCRQEHSVEDITIRFSETTATEGKGEGDPQAKSSSSQPNNSSDGSLPTATMKPVSQNTGDTTDNITETRREPNYFPPRAGTAPPSLSLTPTGADDEEGFRGQNGHSPKRNSMPAADFTPSTPPALNRMTHTPLEREELMLQEDENAIPETTKELQAIAPPAFPKELPIPKGEPHPDAEVQPDEVTLKSTRKPEEPESHEEVTLGAPADEQGKPSHLDPPPQHSDDVSVEPKLEEAAVQQVNDQRAQEASQTVEEPTKASSDTVNM